MAWRLPLLDSAHDAAFPPVERALIEPNGLLAFGGDLHPDRLLRAYRRGIFPWYSEGEPILWWSPDPRMVIAPADLHLSRRLRRALRQSDWAVSADRDFAAVIDHCADLPRHGRVGTWITGQMREAYRHLHALGHAHSIEVRDGDGTLVGGLYGIAVGKLFFGESMFSLHSGGSQVAIAALCLRLSEWQFALLDGQVESALLVRLGFARMPRASFVECCRRACQEGDRVGSWRERFGAVRAADLH